MSERKCSACEALAESWSYRPLRVPPAERVYFCSECLGAENARRCVERGIVGIEREQWSAEARAAYDWAENELRKYDRIVKTATVDDGPAHEPLLTRRCERHGDVLVPVGGERCPALLESDAECGEVLW